MKNKLCENCRYRDIWDAKDDICNMCDFVTSHTKYSKPYWAPRTLRQKLCDLLVRRDKKHGR